MTIAIPTVQARAAMLGELLDRLARECAGAEVVVHEHVAGTPARVDFPALMERAAAEGRRWVLQVEDDAWPAPCFGDAALESLSHAEDTGAGALSLFSRSRRDLAMMDAGETYRWQSASAFCMAQAIAVRSDLLPGIEAFSGGWYASHPEHNRAADLLLGAWLSSRRARLLVRVPSLAQHRLSPSTLPGHRGARQSESYRRAFGVAP